MIKELINSNPILAHEFNLPVDVPLTKYTSIRIGGKADILAKPKNKNDLKALIQRAYELDIPVTLFGGGTNLLITDQGIRGLVVITNQLKSKIKISATDSDQKTVIVDAGERLSKICQFAINNNLSGLEFAAGIPGTVGGAIMMNAGTKSGDMASIVQSVEVLDKNSFEFKTIAKKDLDFSYRYLDLSGIIVKAVIKLTNETQNKIEQTFKSNLMKKNATQPVSFPSAGCFFKNPATGKSAGELIEKAGLKGVNINDAMVSEQHCNFIVNTGNATCEDVLLLKQNIQEIVFSRFNVRLETEVRIEGE